MAFVVEPLPAIPFHASIVLHVRAHARRKLDPAQRDCSPEEVRAAASLLFGVDESVLMRVDFAQSSSQRGRLALAAQAIAKQTGKEAVALGNDAAFVQRCVSWLEARVRAEPAFNNIFATDPQTLLVLSEAMDIATTRSPRRQAPIPVLLCGETGTGKEGLAHAIHDIAVARGFSKNRFVPVHIAGLAEDLANDELFGHKKGAFTDAREARAGQIEAADGGTLLIDEVGDLSPAAQLRLLRVVQDGLVARAGENEGRPTAVRILAATNRNLEQALAQGAFRRDLLHRLRQGWLTLPPLRARTGWDKQIVDAMLGRHGHTVRPTMVRSARDSLGCYDWPGNLRELDGVLEIAAANADGAPIRVEHLPRDLQARYLYAPLEVRAAGDLADDLDAAASDDMTARRVHELSDRIAIESVAAANQEIAAMISFHEAVPDRSVEHARTIEQLKTLQMATRERDGLVAVSGMWARIAARGLPEPVANAVGAERERALSSLEAKRAEVAALEQSLDIRNDPWWKFASEVTSLPVFDANARPAILQFIVTAMRTAASVDPRIAEYLTDRVRQGGLAAMRTAFVEFVRESNEHEALAEAFDLPSATASQWAEWSQRYPKKRDFVLACARDAKTVAKYMDRACKGRDPWRSRQRKVRASR